MNNRATLVDVNDLPGNRKKLLVIDTLAVDPHVYEPGAIVAVYEMGDLLGETFTDLYLRVYAWYRHREGRSAIPASWSCAGEPGCRGSVEIDTRNYEMTICVRIGANGLEETGKLHWKAAAHVMNHIAPMLEAVALEYHEGY